MPLTRIRRSVAASPIQVTIDVNQGLDDAWNRAIDVNNLISTSEDGNGGLAVVDGLRCKIIMAIRYLRALKIC
jgi:hypothetical protein